jgi:hypothetical protein
MRTGENFCHCTALVSGDAYLLKLTRKKDSTAETEARVEKHYFYSSRKA